jgi:hypothetical protein
MILIDWSSPKPLALHDVNGFSTNSQRMHCCDEELQLLPVERHDQPPEESPAEGIPLVPGRVQRGIQQEQPLPRLYI